MASTSSASSIQTSFKYDVFLSFRGEDVRKTFVDHLYHALQQKGIITYKDDEKIQKGERVGEQLIRSIKESRFYIIVFSKNYASSSWCLDELVQIMQCQETKEQTAYPVFYDVEPTEVRLQSGAVAEAFAKLVAKGKRKRTLEDVDRENEDDVGRWRHALTVAAGLAGWELKNTFDGHEAKFIQQIVNAILLKPHFINSSVDGKLVGMDTRVKNVVTSLEIDYDDVRIIGIKGIGGGGKTTLARAVFDHISNWFEGNSFVENVREVSKGSLSGLKKLQKKVLKDVLNDQSVDVKDVYDGKNKMKKMLGSRKVLVVLDDVDNIGQLEVLAGNPNWFKSGSRIIITTRDEQVLIAHWVHFIHDVNLLSKEEAVCLFSRHAFGREIPNNGYEELSEKVVQYANGLPLTIKVLGSHLCGRSEPEWVDAIKRLKTIPLKEILEMLALSYNGLENDEKEIFLDVVCILKGETKYRAIRILQSCGFNAQIGLRVLEQKSLITVEHGYLGFHDHIEEMGWNIVRRLHPNEPSTHSRLWIQEEIKEILVNELGTNATRSIKLDYPGVVPVTIMKGLRKMKELRLLYVNDNLSKYVPEYDRVSPCLPDAFQSLCWLGYPFRSFPQTFHENKLVNLDMCVGNTSELLWELGERQVLNKLKFLDLSYSVLRTFDLRVTPHLEVLNLQGCKNLVEIQFPVECPNLKVLNVSRSKVSNLKLGMTLHLEELNLEGCSDFDELHMPVECPNLKVLNLSGSKVSNLVLGMTLHHEELNLEGCNDFEELHMPNVSTNLKILNPSGSKVSNLKLGMNPHLERLYLKGCFYLQKIHAPVGCLKKLVDFFLEGGLWFERFMGGKKRESADLDSTDITVHCVDVCPLHPSNKLPGFRFTCKYDEPRSSWSGNLEKLISFGPCVCENIDYILATICGLQHLRELKLEKCIPRDLWRLESIEKLSLNKQQFQHLPDSICMLKHLKSLDLDSCFALEHLPENIHELECLEVLRITGCKSLRDIPNSVCKMKCLKRLELKDCENIKKLPEELGSLECLGTLEISGTSISSLPQSINQLKDLHIYGLTKQYEPNDFTWLFRFFEDV